MTNCYLILFVYIVSTVHAQNLEKLPQVTTISSVNLTTPKSKEILNKTKLIKHRRKLFYPSSSKKSIYCSCDLTVNACDLNCCCDQSCTDQDRKLFSHCKSIEKDDENLNFCIDKNILYSNNTNYEGKKFNLDLFCIASDNRKQAKILKDRKPITSISEYRKIAVDVKSIWSEKTKKTNVQQSVDLLPIFGDPIWAIRVNRIKLSIEEKFTLPFSAMIEDAFCDSFKEAKYLQNSIHSCLREVTNLEIECQSNVFLKPSIYYENIYIKKLGQFEYDIDKVKKDNQFREDANDTLSLQFESDNDNNMFSSANEFRYVLMDEPDCVAMNECIAIDYQSDEVFSFPHLQKQLDGSVHCTDVVNEVHYTFYYYPEDGIESVAVNFKYHNLTRSKSFRQKFSVTFKARQGKSINKTESLIELSGNPGYQFGKPVLFRNENINHTLPLNYNHLIYTNYYGQCNNHTFSVEPIKFGINRRAGCMINITSLYLERSSQSICQSMQEKISYFIDGESKVLTHVGVFGNSNISISSDWIAILMDNEAQIQQFKSVPRFTSDAKCPAIITGLSIEIFYTYVGSQAQPQAKIISMTKKYHSPREIRMRCKSLFCKKDYHFPLVELSNSVSFVLINSIPQTIYASPPVIDFHLPADFFYPFSANNQLSYLNDNHNFKLNIVITVLLIVVLV